MFLEDGRDNQFWLMLAGSLSSRRCYTHPGSCDFGCLHRLSGLQRSGILEFWLQTAELAECWDTDGEVARSESLPPPATMPSS